MQISNVFMWLKNLFSLSSLFIHLSYILLLHITYELEFETFVWKLLPQSFKKETWCFWKSGLADTAEHVVGSSTSQAVAESPHPCHS